MINEISAAIEHVIVEAIDQRVDYILTRKVDGFELNFDDLNKRLSAIEQQLQQSMPPGLGDILTYVIASPQFRDQFAQLALKIDSAKQEALMAARDVQSAFEAHRNAINIGVLPQLQKELAALRTDLADARKRLQAHIAGIDPATGQPVS